MKIYCTEEEFQKMANSCKSGDCTECVLEDICSGSSFVEFIEAIDCSANENDDSVIST